MKPALIAIFIGGLVFGVGLSVSGMTKPEVVLSFLQLKDFGLLLVMGGAVVVAMLAYNLLPKLMKRPLAGKEFKEHSVNTPGKTVFGAALFGLGWGISGICPGSALASLGVGNIPILIGIAGIFLGAYVDGFIESKLGY
jgi:hypothetical protein